MGNTGINQKWADKKAALMGTQMTVPLNGVIDAVRFPDGKIVKSPYRDNNPGNEVVNSEEAKRYLGQTGTIVGVSFQERHIQMNDGAVVFLLVAEEK